MRRRSGAMTAGRAREILGVTAQDDADAVARAYRRAVKAAHPDRGGDAERLQEVLEAHRVLQKLALAQTLFAPARRAAEPGPRPRLLPVRLDLPEAIFGVRRRLEPEPGRWLEARVPAGVRSGEVLTVRTDRLHLKLQIEVTLPQGVTLKGSDIWLEVPAPARKLREGQRIELQTPRGKRAFAAPPALKDGGLVRLRGQGLPARGPHAAGDLIVKLVREEATALGARELLRRFSARWAA